MNEIRRLVFALMIASIAMVAATQLVVGAQPSASPSPVPKTPEPTWDAVESGTQIRVMIVYLIVLLVLLGLVLCMVKSCRCCERCLGQTIGCQSCEKNCSGKKVRRDSRDDYLYFRCFPPSVCLPVRHDAELSIIWRQLYLLVWKRVLENYRNSGTSALYYGLPLGSLVVIKIIYGMVSGFDSFKSSGVFEVFAAPLLFIVCVQMTTVSLVGEKSSRLLESLRIMSMRDVSYWLSYFVVDAFCMGILLSLCMTIFSAALGLFWVGGQGHANNGDGNYGELFLLLFLSIISLTSLAFTLSSIFDSPQSAGTAALLSLLGGVVVFFVLTFTATSAIDSALKQMLWCLYPPMALQIGLMTRFNVVTLTCNGVFEFVCSNDTISFGAVLGILAFDVFLYSYLAWYFAQVVPSKFGASKVPWFLCQSSFWFASETSPGAVAGAPPISLAGAEVPVEPVDESVSGEASVAIHSLNKTFGDEIVVNDLSFNLYEGQCFALLGHNGAGKTTAMNMLTGVLRPDPSSGHSTVYGHSIQNELAATRRSLGICPQQDILFDQLTTREHILFFSLMKNWAQTFSSAEEEADELLKEFKLDDRASHRGAELSGGMRRKLSTSIAVCGGSKFLLLDEPTAGMDPLARREFWDLLKALQRGRTILLTTHYMDEADVLGDRIAILSGGKLQCLGSSNFLKKRYGSGYKVIFSLALEESAQENSASASLELRSDVQRLVEFTKHHVPGSAFRLSESSETRICLILPYSSLLSFSGYFSALDENVETLNVANYGVAMPTLEEVFLRTGGDHDLEHKIASNHCVESAIETCELPDSDASVLRQVFGLSMKRINIARNDLGRTIPLVGFPVAIGTAGILLNVFGVLAKPGSYLSSVLMALVIAAGYLPVVSIVTEAVVSERVTKLRNVLSVMGCSSLSYWLGTFCGDFILITFSNALLYIVALFCSLAPAPVQGYQKDDDYLEPMISGGLFLWLLTMSSAQTLAFCYMLSFFLSSPKIAIATMPFFSIILIFLPVIFTAMFWFGLGPLGADLVYFADVTIPLNMLRGIVVCSPIGALAIGIMAISNGCEGVQASECVIPPFWQTAVIILSEFIIFSIVIFTVDLRDFAPMEEIERSVSGDTEAARLDDDVMQEKEKVSRSQVGTFALRLKQLTKFFPSKNVNAPPLCAVNALSLGIQQGEMFGLLGANGAGKTTALSCTMRVLRPNSGSIHIKGLSVAKSFSEASKHLGVVTQHNTLWPYLSVEDHLRLFARLRGVAQARLETVVKKTVVQMELGPYKQRLAGQLSGGMKRKLCVAAAIIGEPDVVMLDEPSAGLDPVSRRNLWDTLISTMGSRAVLLTTHSMEEAEALCTRVGIMVEGELKCIGTPQHLKDKFGSGYEVVLQLDPKEGVASHRLDCLSSFVFSLFDNAVLISSNGGLLTYRVPLSSMRISRAFEALEYNREALGLSDYAVSQPTLEQVFVSTVKQYQTGTGDSAPRNDEENTRLDQRIATIIQKTGPRKKFLGLSRRAHRTTCMLMSIFIVAGNPPPATAIEQVFVCLGNIDV